jgi:hypothetical protein
MSSEDSKHVSYMYRIVLVELIETVVLKSKRTEDAA